VSESKQREQTGIREISVSEEPQIRQSPGNRTEKNQPAPRLAADRDLSSQRLGKTSPPGTFLFYNIEVADRFHYSPVKATLLVLLLAVLYVGWVFLNRYWDERGLERAAQKKKESASRLPEGLATDELKIVQFYASPPQVPRGTEALLCYGVINAAAVRITPNVEPITPALSRCVSVRPEKTTEYTLTAESKTGVKQIAAVEVRIATKTGQ
jgi:hypothetical protein